MSKTALIVHGGGGVVPPDEIEPHKSGCRAAVLTGWKILQSGGHALDAVEAAIRVLEDDPTYNAGRGSGLNREGQIELDAAIMDGHSLKPGAVAAVQNIKNPITLARSVLESEYVFVVGRGASLFASEAGTVPCSIEELVVEREFKRWQIRQEKGFNPSDYFGVRESDTVGAVAIDQQGNIAAGNSTGGSPYKHPGRVGDSAIVGCGVYADNSLGGATSTGWGEDIMRVVLAKAAVDLLRDGTSVQEAAGLAVEYLREKVSGLGGVIMIDRIGNIGFSFNTEHMPYAYLSDDLDAPVVGI